MQFDIGLDLFPLLAAVLAAVTCGVLGNFLVVRRLSLMGDAISHSVLPGLVIAFLLTASRSPLAMFLGAAAAGVATVVLVELVKRLGRVEPGAAMGVVFSVLFALGVLLIERAAVRHVDLDADCVLHGQLETLVWYGAPDSLAGLMRWETLEHVPRQVWTLLIACGASFIFVAALFKELRIAAFDPELATTQGFNAQLMHYLLMIFVAAATVASFEAVGSILVIAMLVGPAATARLLTDRLAPQVVWSVVIALAAGLMGYIAATAGPAQFRKDSVNAAGSMAVMIGLLLIAAIIFAPRHGLLMRIARRRRLARSVELEDLLARLYRLEERGVSPVTDRDMLRMGGTAAQHWSRTLHRALRRKLVEGDRSALRLTDQGRGVAERIVRRHRQWETYLVDEAGVRADQVHPLAESFEHLTRHDASPIAPPVEDRSDPHGRPIPPERD